MRGRTGLSPSQKEVEVNKYVFLYLRTLKDFQVGVPQSGVNIVDSEPEALIKCQSLN